MPPLDLDSILAEFDRQCASAPTFAATGKAFDEAMAELEAEVDLQIAAKDAPPIEEMH